MHNKRNGQMALFGTLKQLLAIENSDGEKKHLKFFFIYFEFTHVSCQLGCLCCSSGFPEWKKKHFINIRCTKRHKFSFTIELKLKFNISYYKFNYEFNVSVHFLEKKNQKYETKIPATISCFSKYFHYIH